MKIKSAKVYLLYGHSYFKFMTNVKNLIFTYGANVLKVDDLYKKFVALYSSVTRYYQNLEFEPQTADVLVNAESSRDAYYNSILQIIQAQLVNPEKEISEAAQTLYQIAERADDLYYIQNKDTYLVVNDFCTEMQKHAAELDKLGLKEWMKSLQEENEKYEQILKTMVSACRIDMEVTKSMRAAKGQLDLVYRDIIAKVNALSILEGQEKYKSFIETMNSLVERNSISLFKRSSNDKPQNLDIVPESFY